MRRGDFCFVCGIPLVWLLFILAYLLPYCDSSTIGEDCFGDVTVCDTAGHFCDVGATLGGANTCRLVPLNFYSVINTGTKIPCGTGYSTTSTGASGDTAQEACVCAVGYGRLTANDVTVACTYCPIGYFKTVTDNLSCSGCGANSYFIYSTGGSYDPTSSSYCTTCGVGFVSDDGAYGENKKVACRCAPGHGRYTDNDLTKNCPVCPLGKFKSVDNDLACSYCPGGTFAGSTGSQSCTDCLSGKFSESGYSQCEVPTGQPTSIPSGQPTTQPSSEPTGQPTSQPSMAPSGQPSSQPTSQPSIRPSMAPSAQPTSQPSMAPSGQPSSRPTSQPSIRPSMAPSAQPTSQPSMAPSGQPSSQPSGFPTSQPSSQPSGSPTSIPSSQPSMVPSSQPSALPTGQPSTQPSAIPSGQPTSQPSTSFPTFTDKSFWKNYVGAIVYNATIKDELYGYEVQGLPYYPQQVFKQIDVYDGFTRRREMGTCDEWIQFSYTNLSEINAMRNLSYIEFIVTSELGSINYNRVICRANETANHIISTIVSARRSPITKVIECDGHYWSISSNSITRNSSSSELNVPIPCATSICVDCFSSTDTVKDSSTALTQDCAYNKHNTFIRPCYNPCESSGVNMTQYRNTPGVAKVLNIVYDELEAAPTILRYKNSVTTKSSISFDLDLSHRGNVYCKAFDITNGTDVAPSTITSIRYAVKNIGIGTSLTNNISDTTLGITINSLNPTTSYDVFCITESRDLFRSNITEVLNNPIHKIVINTMCCKTVTISLMTTASKVDYEKGNANYENLVKIVVDQKPSEWIDFTMTSIFTPNTPILTVNKQLLYSYPQAVYSPSRVIFNGKSSENPNNFTALPPFEYPRTQWVDFLGGSILGFNTFDIVLGGPSANEYEIVRTYSTPRIDIANFNATLPAPVPLSIVIKKDGSKVTINFDIYTDRAGQPRFGYCNKILSIQNGRFVEFKTPSPTFAPTLLTEFPSSMPSGQPSGYPSSQPSSQPSGQPTTSPSLEDLNPTGQPSSQPSSQPSGQPTSSPSVPTGQPTSEPTNPTGQPTGQPSGQPSSQPSSMPSYTPNAGPTSNPTINQDSVIFASTVKCVWSDPRTLEMDSDELVSLNHYSNFRVRSNALRAQCIPTIRTGSCNPSNNNFTEQEYLPLIYPNINIIVSLDLPQHVSIYDSLEIDLQRSIGTIGKKWGRFVFKVESNNNPNGARILEEYINTLSPRVSPPISVPSSKLSQGWYQFSVTLCNFIGDCGTASGQVTVHSTVSPLVQILGSDIISIQNNEELRVIASINPMKTWYNSTAGSTVDTSFTWRIRHQSDDGITEWKDISNSASSKNVFRLEPYSLVPGIYMMEVLALSLKWGRLSAAYAHVNVQAGNIVANIKGGATQSIKDGTNVLELSAENTYDSSLPLVGGVVSKAGMNFSWACAETALGSSSTCPLNLVQSTTFPWLLNLTAKPLSERSSVNSAVVSVTAWMSALRYHTQSIEINIISDSLPNVQVTQTNLVNGKINSANKLSIFAMVMPSISVETNTQLNWVVGGLDGEGIDIDDIALTTVTKTLGIVSVSTPFSFNLVIKPNGFPIGRTLDLQLKATLLSSSNAILTDNDIELSPVIASVIVIVNLPPSPGDFNVFPENGIEFLTNFKMMVWDWSDDDLPMMYQFGCFSKSSRFVALSSLSKIGTIETYLPSIGDQNGGFSKVAVKIVDSLDAESVDEFLVKVDEAPLSQVLQSLGESLAKIDTGNIQALQSIIGTGSNILNRVNCSEISTSYCTSLNRNKCTSVPQTCGPCFNYDVYIGESGHKNAICTYLNASDTSQQQYLTPAPTPFGSPVPTAAPTIIIPGINRRLQLTNEPTAAPTLAPTLSPTSAAPTSQPSSSPTSTPTVLPCGGCAPWMLCNATSWSCQLPKLTCPSSCSNRGECTYINVNTGLQVSECYLGYTSCEATCLCYYSYYGSSCEFANETDYENLRRSRHLLLTSLASLTENDEPSGGAAASWLGSLVEITGRADQLYENSSEIIHSILSRTLDTAIERGIPYEDLSVTTQCIDSLVTSQNSIIVPVFEFNGTTERRRLSTDYNFTVATNKTTSAKYAAITAELLSKYSQLISNQFVDGQDSITVMSSRFRFAVFGSTLSRLSNSVKKYEGTFSVDDPLQWFTPLTPLEIAIGTPPFSISLLTNKTVFHSYVDSTNVGNTLSTAVIIMTRSSLYHNPELSSDAITVEFNNIPCPINGCEMDIKIPGTGKINLDRQYMGTFTAGLTPVIITLYCQKYSSLEEAIICPNGEVLRATCTGEEGTIRAYCSYKQGLSQCNSLDNANNTMYYGSSPTTSCAASNIKPTSTVCSCTSNQTQNSINVGSSSLNIFEYNSLRYLRGKKTRRLQSSDDSMRLFSVKNSYITRYEVVLQSSMFEFEPFIVEFLPQYEWTLAYVATFVGTAFIISTIFAFIYRMLCIKKGRKVSPLKHTIDEEEGKKTEKRRNTIESSIDDALPVVLQEGSFGVRITREFLVHHRWLNICYSQTRWLMKNEKHREQDHNVYLYCRFLALFYHIFLPLLCIIALYQFVDPDDGTCESMRFADQCTENLSYLTTGILGRKTRCSWRNNTCFSNHAGSITEAIQVAIYAVIFGTPLSALAEYVYLRVIGLPFTKVAKVKREDPFVAGKYKKNFFLKKEASSSTLDLKSIAPSPAKVSQPNKKIQERNQELATFRTRSVPASAPIPVIVASQMETIFNLLVAHGATVRKDHQAIFYRWWGVSLKGGFISPERGFFNHLMHFDSNQCVGEYVSKVTLRLHEERAKFIHLYSTKKKQNQRLLYLFIRDFVGLDLNKRIIDSKEFRDSITPLSGSSRQLGLIYITLLNILILLAMYMFYINPGLTVRRQQAILFSYVSWIAVELLFSSSMITFLVHFLIPSLAIKDLGSAKLLSVRALRDINKKKRSEEELKEKLKNQSFLQSNDFDESKEETQDKKSIGSRWRNLMRGTSSQPFSLANVAKIASEEARLSEVPAEPIFNTSKYFFVSCQLAAYFPGLANSKILRSYQSEDPPREFRVSKSRFDGAPLPESKNLLHWAFYFCKRLFDVCATIPSKFFFFPVVAQDVFINMFVNICGAYAALAFMVLYNIHPAYVACPILALILFSHFILVSGKAEIAMRNSQYKRRSSTAGKLVTDGIDLEAIDLVNRLKHMNQPKSYAEDVKVIDSEGKSVQIVTRKKRQIEKKLKREQKIKDQQQKNMQKQLDKASRRRKKIDQLKKDKKEERKRQRKADEEEDAPSEPGSDKSSNESTDSSNSRSSDSSESSKSSDSSASSSSKSDKSASSSNKSNSDKADSESSSSSSSSESD